MKRSQNTHTSMRPKKSAIFFSIVVRKVLYTSPHPDTIPSHTQSAYSTTVLHWIPSDLSKNRAGGALGAVCNVSENSYLLVK